METTKKPEEKQKGYIAKNNSTDAIDLLALLEYVLQKWETVVLYALLGAVLLNAYSFFMMTPQYTSTAKLYIVSSSSDTVVDLTDLNIGTSLTNDYVELIMSYPVLDQVISRLKLDMKATQLASLISISNPSSTRVLALTVTTSDADLSVSIANTLAAVAIDYLPETMNTVKPNVAQVARRATSKSSPSYLKFTLIGAFMGAAIYAAYLVLRFMTDDTIKNQDDIETAFGVTVLACIPENHQMHIGNSSKHDAD